LRLENLGALQKRREIPEPPILFVEFWCSFLRGDGEGRGGCSAVQRFLRPLCLRESIGGVFYAKDLHWVALKHLAKEFRSLLLDGSLIFVGLFDAIVEIDVNSKHAEIFIPRLGMLLTQPASFEVARLPWIV